MKNNIFNLAEELTNQIITQLESGIVPWQKEWVGTPAYNYITGKTYSTLNQMFLKGGAYLTFKQVSQLGGKVKSKAKSSMVAFFSFYDKKETVTNLKTNEDEEITITKACLKYYRVFHQSDIENIEFEDKDISLFDNSKIEDAETLVNNYFNNTSCTLDICFGSDKAFYSPSHDEVVIPDISQFKSSESYYATLFHEMTHSTGHISRLNRNMASKFGSKSYAKEELVAEIGSAMLNSMVGISSQKLFDNSVAYIDGWIKSLKNDHNLIVHASARAEKAVNLILSQNTSKIKTAA
ncbi:ArdC family protein [Francisella sp. SYW-9]|uniref:ArdC family protein n=1 Tax=Francisella sp. SYW-9 TaxID=2610888 RepID=UPI00123D7C8F|nr:zincin-like metallopeptidase domain-containing protein [Francisella sp. SYW-9]